MRGLNKVTLIGNLGKDPDVQTLDGNIKVAKFSMATTESYKDNNGQNHTITDWHNIVLWRGLADLANNYLHKGSLVYVEGKIKTRNYDDKDGQKKYVTEIIAEQLILLDKKPMAIEIKYEIATHHGKDVIFIRFDRNLELNERIKKLLGVKWSNTLKAWYVRDSAFYREKFGLTPKSPIGKEVLSNVHAVNHPALQKYVKTLQLKAYSPSTIATYRNEFAQLLYILKDKNVDDLDSKRLRDYFLYCTNTLKISENTLHSRINAVKFYFEKVLGRDRFFFEIPRPKKALILPNVLAISQVGKLFSKLENLKHKTMLFLAYSAGLRVSEVVNLRVKDIHSARMVINIKGAKGKKDRMVSLSEGILDLLRKYYLSYKPKDWLFEGQHKEEPYCTRSLQQIFHRAKNEARIIQDVTFHSLRHSYATHLHERGTDIKLIQELLGHNDIQTTMRYTHVSTRKLETIVSPFDQLNLKDE